MSLLRKLEALAICLVLAGCGDRPHAKDQAMLDHFARHEKGFEELAAMIREDSKLVRVDKDWTGPRRSRDRGSECGSHRGIPPPISRTGHSQGIPRESRAGVFHLHRQHGGPGNLRLGKRLCLCGGNSRSGREGPRFLQIAGRPILPRVPADQGELVSVSGRRGLGASSWRGCGPRLRPLTHPRSRPSSSNSLAVSVQESRTKREGRDADRSMFGVHALACRLRGQGGVICNSRVRGTGSFGGRTSGFPILCDERLIFRGVRTL